MQVAVASHSLAYDSAARDRSRSDQANDQQSNVRLTFHRSQEGDRDLLHRMSECRWSIEKQIDIQFDSALGRTPTARIPESLMDCLWQD